MRRNVSFSGSERESGETCILRGFLKGSYFRSAGPPKQQILARMADKPGSRCGNGAPRAERWNVSHNGSARPRSLETRKGRGFPHSHSDGDCGCQIGQTAKTRVNHAFFQILVQNQLNATLTTDRTRITRGSCVPSSFVPFSRAEQVVSRRLKYLRFKERWSG